ncbi:MAG TPA: tetratricopeptide repeat protein [Trueperaceae bacterium]
MKHFRRCLLWLLAPLLAAFAIAQPQPAGSATELLAKARALAQEARAAYAGTILNIDQPLWSQAVHTAEQALAAQPDSTEVLRFLAETYNTLAWDIRAWTYWNRYLDAGGTLDEQAKEGLSEAGTELGFARYRVGDMQGALAYYQKVHDLLPDDQEALTWLGRIHFELGQPQEALPYWRQLTQLAPQDAGAAYYLKRVQRQLEVGVAAEAAFQAGMSAYDAGNKAEALEHFDEATRLTDGFEEALSWAGRVSLELGRSQAAKNYWQQVLALDPGNQGAAYFLSLAEDQLHWGAEAARAYHEGETLYHQGKLAEASARFAAAATANPSFKDAALWAARSYQELGAVDKAVPYWKQVLSLDPSDKQVAELLQLAQSQLVYGAEAASAFMRGLSSYRQVEFGEAEGFFRKAVEANPNDAEAWAWLGRIYFDQADYGKAAVSYGHAADLDPGNESYDFFAREARRLSPKVPEAQVP